MATKNIPDVARDLIIRALDALSDRMATAEAENPTPVQRLAGNWRSLNPDERLEVAGYIGAAAGGLAAALPMAIRATRKRVHRRRRAGTTAAPAPKPVQVVLPETDKKKEKDKKDKKDKKKDKKDKKDKKRKKGKKRGKKKRK